MAKQAFLDAKIGTERDLMKVTKKVGVERSSKKVKTASLDVDATNTVTWEIDTLGGTESLVVKTLHPWFTRTFPPGPPTAGKKTVDGDMSYTPGLSKVHVPYLVYVVASDGSLAESPAALRRPIS